MIVQWVHLTRNIMFVCTNKRSNNVVLLVLLNTLNTFCNIRLISFMVTGFDEFIQSERMSWLNETIRNWLKSNSKYSYSVLVVTKRYFLKSESFKCSPVKWWKYYGHCKSYQCFFFWFELHSIKWKGHAHSFI